MNLDLNVHSTSNLESMKKRRIISVQPQKNYEKRDERIYKALKAKLPHGTESGRDDLV